MDSGCQRKLAGGELQLLVVSSGPGVQDNGKACGDTGRLSYICRTYPFIHHVIAHGAKTIVSLLENKPVLQMQKHIW